MSPEATRARKNAWLRQDRKEAREQGGCGTCRKGTAEEGKASCAACLVAKRARKAADRAAK